MQIKIRLRENDRFGACERGATLAGTGKARASEVEVLQDSARRKVSVGALVLVCWDPVAAPAERRPGLAPASVGDTWTYHTEQSAPGPVMPGGTTTDRIVADGSVGARWVGRMTSEQAGALR